MVSARPLGASETMEHATLLVCSVTRKELLLAEWPGEHPADRFHLERRRRRFGQEYPRHLLLFTNPDRTSTKARCHFARWRILLRAGVVGTRKLPSSDLQSDWDRAMVRESPDPLSEPHCAPCVTVHRTPSRQTAFLIVQPPC